ncbi:putative Esterase/lipase/thioesterase [Oceanicola granulosus HTCC2516]|uniref:Putative Esterase/lipase/thioesterase n=1 Tax=Oceanicola granulosus (strain ATCC BAA-861 / DSM 15982 / KCTC 12143 / HTCC2516) TaxID=314256 RepID=Q2CEQ6_OCEGH|nr:alpha/beta hydrolase [Oceanicola granulosus]EAR51202.1 putative Esterase/lipase/thioesterase [Oceanicola granulosus HTCC2516]
MDPAPFHADVADGPDGGGAHWIVTRDGVRLRAGHWPCPGARGTVLLFTGRTEYIEKYGRAARALAERGFATATLDWRGQGLSARLRDDPLIGHVRRFADYQHDVAALLAHARTLGLPEPFHLLAHSMGGAIGLRALYEGLPVKGAAFSAPMWGIQLSASLRPLAWGLSTLARQLRFGHLYAPGQSGEPFLLRGAFELNTLTSDEEMFLYMQRQIQQHPDLALGGPSLHWLNEALGETRRLAARPAPSRPCVTFLGTDETIVDTARIRARMAGWSGGELVSIEGGRHEVLMETPRHRRAVFDRLAEEFGP